MLRTYYNNFGYWEDMDDPEVQDFYAQRESVEKECEGCGRRTIRCRPDYAYCNACADLLERG